MFKIVNKIICYRQNQILTTLFIHKSPKIKVDNVKSTIFALSSGYGKCGVAVIRVSGPQTKEALKCIAGFKNLPEPRKAFLRKLRNPISKEVLDHGLVLWFPGPKSFTGEDCCEFQVHGGPAVISAILRSLSSIKTFRPAEPGEFTKQAFYAGKLDLTEVEGLADLIHAETDVQRKQALIQMDGGLSRIYSNWRSELLEYVARMEAYIDFSEDQLLDENIVEGLAIKVRSLRDSIKAHIVDGRKGERVRDGVITTILGAPNVGKSSLMNILCREEAAIVSNVAGTTRDVVKRYIDICGYPMVLCDTAGLRVSTGDFIEDEGMCRARKSATNSDLVLLVIDGADLETWCNERKLNIKQGFTSYVVEYKNYLGIKHRNYQQYHLTVINKIDLMKDTQAVNELSNTNLACISCTSSQNISPFIQTVNHALQTLCGMPNKEQPCLSQLRHRRCLEECIFHLDNFLNNKASEDLLAHEIHQALNCIAKITGHISCEQILDVIFNSFCIGK